MCYGNIVIPFDNDCKFTYSFTAHMHEIPKYFYFLLTDKHVESPESDIVTDIRAVQYLIWI